MIKEFKNIYTPEVQPWHKIEFSIASQLKLEGADLQKKVIPAGTLLKATTTGKRIELEPEKGVKIALVADVAEKMGVLIHDVEVEEGVDTYAVGVMIKGVVYDDVMKTANTGTNWTEAVKEALLPNITTYNVITEKK